MGDDNKSKRRRASTDRGLFERPRGSGVWWARYHDEHGREHRERVGPKALARKVYAKRKTEVHERRFFPESIGRRDTLLVDMIDDVVKRAKGRIRAFSDYERYAKYWKEAFPGRTLAQIAPGDVERYQAERIKTCAPATVNREVKFLKRVFNVAVADGLVAANPTNRVKLYRENNERVRFLTADEETKLREAMKPEDWPLVAFAIHTGMRQGEQFELRWSWVDFTTGMLTIPRSKSGKLRRVPMNDTVRALLRELPSRGRSELVFPSKPVEHKHGRHKGKTVGGKSPVDARNFLHRAFLPALKRAKIDGMRWHDLRHTFASRLVMAGVDIRTVQELMGHASITMTQRYAHLSPSHQLDAVQKLNAPTGTTTGTEPEAAEQPNEATAQAVGMDRKKSAPGWIRTSDHRLRRPVLYPTELRARSECGTSVGGVAVARAPVPKDDARIDAGRTEGLAKWSG